MRNTLAAFLILLLLSAASVLAEVPHTLSYQGKLLDSEGAPADGTFLMKFIIYDDADAGATELWNSTYRGVSVSNGLFNYVLGDSTALPEDLFSGHTDLYLGISVGTDPELSPRIKLTAAAWANHSLRSDTAGYALAVADNSISGAEIVDRSIETEDVAFASIGSAEILNGSIGTSDLDYDAVDAARTLDEPGLAYAYTMVVTLSDSTAADICTVTIDVPARGYIHLTGVCRLGPSGNSGDVGCWLQIDETEGGSSANPNWSNFFKIPASVASSNFLVPACVQRVYYVSSGGEYTYRLEGVQYSGTGGYIACRSASLVATYYPTSYEVGKAGEVIEGDEK